MALSEHEQRLLDEMERNLYGRDADHHPAPSASGLRPSYRNMTLGVVIAVAGVVGLLGGVMTQFIILGIVGFIAMFVGVLIASKPTVAGPEDVAPNAKKSAKQGSTFMQRMEQRWDDRQDGRL